MSGPQQATTAQPAPLNWLTDALNVARAGQNTRAKGADAPPVVPQPWMTNAMLNALNKYDALARARGENESENPEPDSPS